MASDTPIPANRPLKIGVMLNSLEINAWRYKVLQDISASDFCELALVIINDRPPGRASRISRISNRIREWHRRGLFKAYVRWDRRHFRVKKNAFAQVDASALLPEDIRLRVRPKENKFTDRFSDADIESIKEADLDVLLRFGFRIIKGEILNCAKYGVWSYHHGDNREYRGGPALFWEIYERNPVSGVVLQVLNEELDGGRVIYRSWSSTSMDSLFKNRNAVYWKASEFVLRRLRDLNERGWNYVSSCETQDNTYQKGIYRSPSNAQMIPFLFRILGSRVQRKVERSLLGTYNHWRIIVRPAGSWSADSNDRDREMHLVPPQDRFYADPAVFKYGERSFVFFEDYRFVKGKGVVSCCEIRPGGGFGRPEVVLEADYHLSYPFVFEHAGGIYMIPETKEAGRIELHRAVEFPARWQLEGVLAEGVEAVDATIYEADSTLWLFCNVAAEGAPASDELHLFRADDLHGPWLPHRKNPIVSDVRRARPAGRLFKDGGSLIRPSQDCSVRYGYAINLNRVKVLTENDYEEETIRKITPDWLPGSVATHTLSSSDDYEALDAKFLLRRVRIPGWADGCGGVRMKFRRARS